MATIIEAIDDAKLFGRQFEGESWAAWRSFLSALFGLELTEEQIEVFQRHTGRETVAGSYNEAWVIAGRRGGKSRIAALIAVFLACFRDYSHVLSTGERGVLAVLAADRRQARTIFRYVEGLIDSVPMLHGMVSHRTKESIEFTNGIDLEIHTSSYRSVRGYTIVGAILDEVSFWRQDDSANPDTEILRAIRPSMATVDGALLLAVTTPYARRGEAWKAFERHYGKDSSVLVWQAPTEAMNPAIPKRVIEEAYEDDPLAAEAEYGAQFRKDIEGYASREAVEAVIVPGRGLLPLVPGVRYVAFTDPSGGVRDSMTLAIAHREGDRAVLDCVVETRPPFSPEGTVEQYAAILKGYRVREVTGDRYAGEWPREQYRKHGVRYLISERSKSDIYRDLLPLIHSGAIELLDIDRLKAQLLGLERRTSRAGRDSIDHGPGGMDDVINSVAGALTLAGERPSRAVVQRLPR